MGFAKSRLDYFYADGMGQTPNLIALKDIKTDSPTPTTTYKEGDVFYLPIPFGSKKLVAVGLEPILLGENARVLSDAEVTALKVKEGVKAGTDVAQDVADKALNEEGLVRKSNIAWWLLGGVVVYLVFFKK